MRIPPVEIARAAKAALVASSAENKETYLFRRAEDVLACCWDGWRDADLQQNACIIVGFVIGLKCRDLEVGR